MAEEKENTYSDPNLVIIAGNLGKAPETHPYGDAGKVRVTFSLANRVRGVTQWLNVVCFNETADYAISNLAQGSKVEIKGRLQLSTYTSKEGVEKTSVQIMADGIFPRAASNNGNGGTKSAAKAATGARAARPAATRRAAAPAPADDDDVPF